MVPERSLADRPMLTAGGVQFVVGCALEGEQGIVGTGYGQEDLVELALGRPLMAALGVLDDEDPGQGQGGYDGLEYRFPPGRKSCPDAHDDPCPGAVTTTIAARGRDAYRSTLDSHRLTTDLDSPRACGGSATEPGNRC